jgi:hypothetical protein
LQLKAMSIQQMFKPFSALLLAKPRIAAHVHMNLCTCMHILHVLCCTLSLCCAAVAVVSGGEGSGPLYPPQNITEDCFPAGEAVAAAYARAGLSTSDIHYWGLYDCFPICLIR